MNVPFLDVAASSRELRPQLDAACARVLESGTYILGSEVAAFETAFAAYCEARHCIGVANGLDALQLILRAYDIGPGDEVVVPANTFVATWLAVSLAGGRPVPVEPDERSHTVGADAVARALSPRTRAIIAVHLYGRPADMDALRTVADAHGVPLIEDAAQAHGARWRGRRAGSLGAAAAFSFYPAKNLGAVGDAGAVVTSDDALADKLRLLRNYGSTVKYRHEVKGLNSRLDPLQAAILSVKLAHLEEWNARRRRIAQIYLERLAGVPNLMLPERAADAESSWHLFVIRHPQRDYLAKRLKQMGVETLVHYPVPPHLSPAYRELAYPPGRFPIAERLADTVLSLPIGPHLEPETAGLIAACVRDAGTH